LTSVGPISLIFIVDCS